MNGRLDRLEIKGFKSIKECEVEFRNLNVLIGSNGSGKSNILSIFDLLRSIFDKELSTYIGENGVNAILHNGIKHTQSLEVRLVFDRNGYGFELRPDNDGRMMFGKEYFSYKGHNSNLGSGHTESVWEDGVKNGIDPYVIPLIKSRTWRIYHFHDTGKTSLMKQYVSITDNMNLSEDARNIAPSYIC